MWPRASLVAMAACGYPELTPLDEVVVVTASPEAFDLHANDARETRITVTNETRQTVEAPTLQVAGFTLGTLTFTAGTCTAPLAPGASCTAIGQLVATAPGELEFEVIALASPSDPASTTLSLNARPPCAGTCGPGAATNCCASGIVEGNAPGATRAGETFFRGFDAADATDMTHPAQIGDYRLDDYEVTVARFRVFVNAGEGTRARPPAPGAGARTLGGMPGQGGWETSFDADLSATTADLISGLNCDAGQQTWRDSPSPGENKPINCVTWLEAMAFCVWDGGFLPTEAEWNYAASGGAEQRAFPWSAPPSSLSVDPTRAAFMCLADGTAGCTLADIIVPGSKPTGDGRFGQSDLGGNVFEWTLDFDAAYPDPCTDCANLTPSTFRVMRGGAFTLSESLMRTGARGKFPPANRDIQIGVRCARAR